MTWRRGGRRLAGGRVDGPRRRAAAAPRGPVFTEATAAALGGNASFRAQLGPRPRRLARAPRRRVPVRSGMGHHGVSVGDADGDGLDDLYVAQPAGLPNRLFRNRGDGTLRGRDRGGGPGRARQHVAVASSPTSTTTATRTSCWSPQAGLLLFTNDGKGSVHAGARRLPRAAAAPGLAHLGGHGGLRPRRLPRRLPLHVLVLHRRQRGQGGHRRSRTTTPATARPTCCSGTTATGASWT